MTFFAGASASCRRRPENIARPSISKKGLPFSKKGPLLSEKGTHSATPHEPVSSRMARSLVLRLLTTGLTASLLILPAACQQPAQQADALAQQASQLADAGDRLGALVAIQKAIALRDDNASYFLLLASIQLRAGQPVDAFLAGERALELDAANVDALTLVANVGMQVGQLDDAFDAANRLLALDPNSLIGLQVKGLYDLYKNRGPEAEATAQKLLAISPSDVAGVIIRARVLAKAGKYAEALALVDKSMSDSSVSAPLLITQINLYRVLARPEEMARAFEQLARLVPERAVGMQLDEINLLYRLGRKDQARAATMALLSKRSAGVADLAIVLRLWSEYDRVPFTRETIKVASEWSDPLALLVIGRYLLWQKQPQLADDLYFSFPEAARTTAVGIHLRASARLGDPAEAISFNERLLERDGDNVDGLLLRGETLEKAGNLPLAIEAVQRAMNADPSDPDVYVALGRLQAKSGAVWRGTQIFEDGLQQMPQSFQLIEEYTQFLHESGNKSRAVTVSRAFARAMPSSIRAWTIMAQQCAWAGNAACAAEAAAGRTAAASRFRIDEQPGTPPDRGLLGKF